MTNQVSVKHVVVNKWGASVVSAHACRPIFHLQLRISAAFVITGIDRSEMFRKFVAHTSYGINATVNL